tara:strand:+ start:446 stop:643 length:198 start_codon:yes stop_codon:yes gene_type:complete
MPRQITVSEFAIENLVKRGITPPEELLHDAIREENNPYIKNELVLYNYKQCVSICKNIGAPCSCL